MQSSTATVQLERHEPTIEEVAETFVSRLMDGQPIALEIIHQATVRHLVQTQSLSLQRAQIEAAKAVAVMNARATKARFDVSQSTNTCIFIKDEDGQTHAITVPEALALCKGQDHNPTT